MSNSYFSPDEKISAILERYPQLVDEFIRAGFSQFADEKLREKMTAMVTLQQALQLRKINVEDFCHRLEQAIEEKQQTVDETLSEDGFVKSGELRLEGVLPCPIRLPLLEGFRDWLASRPEELRRRLGYDLRSASTGIDWLVEQVKSGDLEQVPDIMMSAGFELFFDRELMGRFLQAGAFETPLPTGVGEMEQFSDERCRYGILGVVPAVFIVNEEALNGRPVPTSWKMLLCGDYVDQVAIPLHDLDMFNALILHIHAFFGEDGVRALARAFHKSLHPSQMVKGVKNRPAPISISPYFFTQMLPENGPAKAVWPTDGAISSPIFMVVKKDKQEALQPVIDFLRSQTVGEIFSAGGKFPSTHPAVDNRLAADQRLLWVGWEYLNRVDVAAELHKAQQLFDSILAERENQPQAEA
ncbi:MAG: ABC transporter substrate-binding protein [Eubacteriales bacterium]|nr:ABC transporter substrate-binding protein [Eubacteriales bacterium]